MIIVVDQSFYGGSFQSPLCLRVCPQTVLKISMVSLPQNFQHLVVYYAVIFLLRNASLYRQSLHLNFLARSSTYQNDFKGLTLFRYFDVQIWPIPTKNGHSSRYSEFHDLKVNFQFPTAMISFLQAPKVAVSWSYLPSFQIFRTRL